MRRRYAARLLEEWNLTGCFPLVVVHPGGASNPGMTMPQKRWPAPRIAALADRLVDQTGAKILVVGHGADHRDAKRPLAVDQHLTVGVALAHQMRARQQGAAALPSGPRDGGGTWPSQALRTPAPRPGTRS